MSIRVLLFILLAAGVILAAAAGLLQYIREAGQEYDAPTDLPPDES